MISKKAPEDLPERFETLRRAHVVLASELTAAQRRLDHREREVRELRAALRAYRALRTPQRASYS